MSVLDGPGEGTWSVFAQKVVEERDTLRDKVASLEAELARAKGFYDVAVQAKHTLVCILASEFEWSDTSYLHAMLHVENAIRNLRADARAAQAERDEAKAAWSEQLRELERTKEAIAKLAEQRDHWCDMSRIRLEEADQLREELARLHRLVPTGTYTVSLPHEQEIQRLRAQLENVLDSHAEGAWQARALDAEEAANGLREALRAAEKRELEALAALNEREADVETLQTHVEVQREALQKTSKAVAKLVVPVTKIAELLEENGCDCECEHCWEDHDEDCERCLACRISMAIQKEDE